MLHTYMYTAFTTVSDYLSVVQFQDFALSFLFVISSCIIRIKYRAFHGGGQDTGPSTGMARMQDLLRGWHCYRTFHRVALL